MLVSSPQRYNGPKAIYVGDSSPDIGDLGPHMLVTPPRDIVDLGPHMLVTSHKRYSVPWATYVGEFTPE